MTYTENKKAYFNYEILEKFEGGLELQGQEVKSIKSGKASIAGAYAAIRGGELYLLGSQIPPYQQNNIKEGFGMNKKSTHRESHSSKSK